MVVDVVVVLDVGEDVVVVVECCVDVVVVVVECCVDVVVDDAVVREMEDWKRGSKRVEKGIEENIE